MSLKEVYEAVEGPIEPVGCLLEANFCDGRSCILGSALEEANEILLRHLVQTRVSDLCRLFVGPDSVPPEEDEGLVHLGEKSAIGPD
jgi:DNA-binding IscR family transcriptional regulator